MITFSAHSTQNVLFYFTYISKDFIYSQVYVWGSNTEGQLGLGPEAEEAVYTPVLLNLHFKVILRASWD
jgi:hypothetical protein